MKMKTDKLRVTLLTGTANDQVIEDNHKGLRSHIIEARSHLTELKQELFKTIDLGQLPITLFNVKKIDGFDDQGAQLHFLARQTPSEFLNKTFPDPTVGKDDNKRYIDFGEEFEKSCVQFKDKLTDDCKLVYDAYKITNAINDTLQNLNGMVYLLDKKNYKEAGTSISNMNESINRLLETANNSKMIELIPNQTLVEKVLSRLTELTAKISSFFSNSNKNDFEVMKERLAAIKSEYKQEASPDATLPDSDNKAPKSQM